jgi:bacteriophage N4 adsorption protein B
LVEPGAAWGVALLQGAQHELLLVAAVGILLLGIEDVLFDALWLARRRQALQRPVQPPLEGTIAVFVPAWQEAAVLPATLLFMLDSWRHDDVRIYVGCYSNDGRTLLAVSALVARHPHLRLVIAPHDGPTSKADNLNQMWRALGEDERAERRTFAAVVLHDAEDRVMPAEIGLFRRHLPGAMLVQIPVEPLLLPGGGVVAAHYADEFAEAHGKEMPLRAAFGTALPAAGVGCAFSRAALTILALGRDSGPFHADSLTEDYEAGLILGASGGLCRFVDECDANGRRIATRSVFPDELAAAVRQKGRWIAGIALGGWDRLDWQGGRTGDVAAVSPRHWLRRLLTGWMLWRDRRATVAAAVLLCAYAGLVLAAVNLVAQWAGLSAARPLDAAMAQLLAANAVLLMWRLILRTVYSGRIYGWRQGLLAVPRAFVGNIIHILAARRALAVYLRQLWTREIIWDKTAHAASQPAVVACSAVTQQ